MSVFLLSLSPELSTLHDCRENYQEKKKAISFQHLDLVQEVPYTLYLNKSLQALLFIQPFTVACMTS